MAYAVFKHYVPPKGQEGNRFFTKVSKLFETKEEAVECAQTLARERDEKDKVVQEEARIKNIACLPPNWLNVTFVILEAF